MNKLFFFIIFQKYQYALSFKFNWQLILLFLVVLVWNYIHIQYINYELWIVLVEECNIITKPDKELYFIQEHIPSYHCLTVGAHFLILLLQTVADIWGYNLAAPAGEPGKKEEGRSSGKYSCASLRDLYPFCGRYTKIRTLLRKCYASAAPLVLDKTRTEKCTYIYFTYILIFPYYYLFAPAPPPHNLNILNGISHAASSEIRGWKK